MRRFFVVLGLLLAVSVPAMAQDTPQGEIFGGFSYLRAGRGANINMSGWQASGAVNLNDWFGIAVDTSGVYEGRPGVKFSLHSVVGGPRFTYRKEERTAPFVHGLLGVTRANEDFHLLVGSTVSEPTTTFTAVFGGGMDVKIGESWALRAGQLDWVITKFRNTRQSNFRYSVGIVYRIGKK
jgi:hypothetical protein